MQHPLLFSICAFLMLLVILSWGGYRVFYKPGRFLKQLGSPVITGAAQRPVLGEMSEPESSTVVTLLKQLGSKIP